MRSAWYIPEPDEERQQRALLHFQLAAEDRHYRELVAPGISGARFVRHLSWAVAGIRLAGSGVWNATRTAHAIEALACKLAWAAGRSSDRLRGSMAFAREPEDYLAEHLRTPQHYVQITFRQSASSALLGLGLAEGSRRFNAMRLTAVGLQLADAFLEQPAGRGGARLGGVLSRWLADRISVGPQRNALLDALDPGKPSRHERVVVEQRLEALTQDGADDPERRARLVHLFARRFPRQEPALEAVCRALGTTHRKQADELRAGAAFETLIERARDLVVLPWDLRNRAQWREVVD